MHLQISTILRIYHWCHKMMLIIFCHTTLIIFCHTFCLKRPSLFCSFHFTKRYVLMIWILFIICCSLFLSLSLICLFRPLIVLFIRTVLFTVQCIFSNLENLTKCKNLLYWYVCTYVNYTHQKSSNFNSKQQFEFMCIGK